MASSLQGQCQNQPGGPTQGKGAGAAMAESGIGEGAACYHEPTQPPRTLEMCGHHAMGLWGMSFLPVARGVRAVPNHRGTSSAMNMAKPTMKMFLPESMSVYWK